MHVLIIGSTTALLFADVVASLRSLVRANQITQRESIGDIANAPPADLVLVLQQWPDEFTQSEAFSLIDAQPLARLIVCYGSWCDSDGRTRDVWPHAVRVPVAEAADRLVSEIEGLLRGGPPLPLTANRDETFAWDHTTSRQKTSSPLLICVISADRVIRDWLRDVLEDAGHTATESVTPTPQLVVWDADPWETTSLSQLAKLQQVVPKVPIVAMCGYPRRHEIRELVGAGIVSVLPKLANNDCLISHLEDIAARSQSSQRQTTTPLRVSETG